MSWANILKKTIPQETNPLVEKSKVKTIPKKSIEDVETPAEIFEWKLGFDLFDNITDVKLECERHTPWLMEHCRSGELYYFFKNFINIKATVESYTLQNEESSEEDSESDDEKFANSSHEISNFESEMNSF